MRFTFGGVDFIILMLIPAILLGFLLLRAKRASRAEMILRFLAVGALLLALLEPYFEKKSEYSSALLLLDISESMEEGLGEELLSRVRGVGKEGSLELNLMPFAGTASRTSIPDSKGLSFRQIQDQWSSLNIGETNIEDLLRSQSLLPGMNVFLVSDGQETKGNLRTLIAELKNRAYHIFPFVPAKSGRSAEYAHVSQITLPLIVALNQSAEIRATVSNPSTKKVTGNLEILHDNQPILIANIEVPAEGEAVYSAQSDSSKEGIKEVTATFKPFDPSLPSSSRSAYLSGESREKVLLLSGAREDARFLAAALSGQAYQLKELNDLEAQGMGDLDQYAVVILNNIARSQLPEDAPEKLAVYVKNGGGFIMIGGERSFGLGDYRGTAVEDILPVNILPPQTKERRLNIAVELVVDKSKSMAQDNRIEFVKDAAREVVRNLKDDDFLGLTAFDTSPFVAIPIGPLREIKQMALDRISIIFPNGKTNLLPAMAQARQALESAPAGRKHMIVLTDGDLPDSGPHYVEFVRQMRFSGITVSTVLIGPEFDRLLRQMSEIGGGAFYNTSDPQALPRIFLRDIKIRSGEETMKEEQEFEVRRGPGSIESTSLKAFPLLYGLVQTQEKKGANLELVLRSASAQQGYPLLASRKYEKGRSIAFSSDANGRWSRTWIGWAKFQEFWDDLVSAAKPSIKEYVDNIKFDLRYYLQGGSLILDVTFITPLQGLEPSAELIMPDGKKRSVDFSAAAKGRFKAELKDPLPGKYELRGMVGEKKLTAVAFHLSGELFGEKKGQGFNVPLLEELASASGGRVNPGIEDIKAAKGKKIEKEDLSIYFILLGAFLIALEIVWREIWSPRKKLKLPKRTPLTPKGVKALFEQKN